MEYKCKGKDRYGSTCRNNKLSNIDYCSFHEYLNDYTSIQLNNLTLCKGCNKWHYLEDIQTCNNCINRGKNNRLKYKTEKILCKKENCTYGKSDLNDYCLKHQIDYFKEETEKLNKKVCYNYKRGCRNQLNKTYNFSKCQNCLKKDRENDHKKRNGVNIEEKDDKNKVNEKIINIKITNDLKEDKINNNIKEKSVLMDEINFNIEKYDKIINKIIRHMKCFLDSNNNLIKFTLNNYLKKCTNDRCNMIYPIKYFISDTNRQEAKQCQFCRDKGKEKDKKESRLQSKKEWNEKNHDKCAQYWMNYRGRKIEKDIDLFLSNNAKSVKAWRDKNPNKVKEMNKRKRENVVLYLNVYKRSASKKNLKFELKDEEYFDLVKQNCYYCGELQDKGFNGIDRKDSTKDYTKDNTVSCCYVCNFIKGCLTDDIFLKRVEHILTYQGYIKGKLNPKLFANYFTISFKNYETRAKKNNIKFELEETVFCDLVIDNCYVCGKVYDGNHINGLDRLNSDLGYTIDNVETCCGECNFMKKKLSAKCFFEKLIKIKNYKLSHLKTINTKLRVNEIILKTNDLSGIQRTCSTQIIAAQDTQRVDDHYHDQATAGLSFAQKLLKPGEFIDSDDDLNETIDNKNNLDEYDLDFYNSDDDYISEKSVISNNNCSNNNNLNKSKKQKIIKTIEQIKEEARIRKRKQREREKETENKEFGLTINKHLNKKTPEQIKEDARLRKQKQRERKKEKYQDKDYIEKRAKELKEKRDNNK